MVKIEKLSVPAKKVQPITLLFTFENEDERTYFLNSLAETSTYDGRIKKTLETHKLDPHLRTEVDRVVGLFVGGAKLKEGPFNEISKEFAIECNSHKATVEIKELLENTWKCIRQRKAM